MSQQESTAVCGRIFHVHLGDAAVTAHSSIGSGKKRDHAAEWRRLTEFMYSETSAKICCQIGHSGGKGSATVGWNGKDSPLAGGNGPLVSASDIPWCTANARTVYGRPHLSDPYWTLHEGARVVVRSAQWPKPYTAGRDQLWRLADKDAQQQEVCV